MQAKPRFDFRPGERRNAEPQLPAGGNFQKPTEQIDNFVRRRRHVQFGNVRPLRRCRLQMLAPRRAVFVPVIEFPLRFRVLD